MHNHPNPTPTARIKHKTTFSKVLADGLAIVEAIKKGLIPTAPVQNPPELQAKVEAANFQQQLEPYKNYGVFLFNRTT